MCSHWRHGKSGFTVGAMNQSFAVLNQNMDSILFSCEQTSVLVDPSGVGKSSSINALRSNQYVGGAEGDNWFDSVGLLPLLLFGLVIFYNFFDFVCGR